MLVSHLPKGSLLAFTTRSHARVHLHLTRLSNTTRFLHAPFHRRGLQSTQFANMFSRAMKSHDLSRPPAAIARPPAATTMQISLQDAFITKKPDILKPAQGNNTSSYRPIQESNMSVTRKRSFSQQNGSLATVFNANSAFQENVPPQTIGDPPSNGVSALHDAVYFDDADFSDDGDLDFDTSAPILYPSLSKAAAALPSPPRQPQQQPQQRQQQQQQKQTSGQISPPRRQAVDTYEDLEFPPQRPQHPQPPHQQEPPSSAPVLWSSSPVEHLQPAKRRSNPKLEEVVEEAEPPKKKPRTFPWLKGQEVVTEETAPAKPASTGRKVGKRNSSNDLHQPWNEPFSNIEAGKKEARKRNAAKQQKRAFTTASDDPEEVRKVRKGKEPIAGIFLSDEQKKVVDLVTNSKKPQSVFFTGSAGTGKSVLLRELISGLKKKHRKDSDAVAVTASTGLAACNIGGVTLHSFAGIGLGKEPVPDLVRKIRRNQKAKTRWIRTKILIMDEISMVDGDLFDKLEAIARQIRNNGSPFGGIQLIITGDFFQLPPVPEGGKIAKFAFDANAWTTCITHTIGLTQVFRQRDPEFARMLNEMRLGKLSPETIATFRKLNRSIEYEDGIQATELFSTRSEVDNSNNQKMRQLPGEAMRFAASDTGTIADPNFRTKLLSSCMAPPIIDLKVHSQVMLIKNVDDSLVNGSLGRVVGFMSEKMFDLMGEEGLSDREKHGGSTIDTSQRWPLVQFAMLDGTSRQLLCQPEQWKVELPNGEIQAARSQIPLILAWALSIHKAQGQTLERVKVDLGRVFEKGQAYVALSRATCKEGLQVLRFDEKKVMAHEKVRQFYNSLYTATEAAKRLGTTAATVTTATTTKKTKATLLSKPAPARNSRTEVFEIDSDEDDLRYNSAVY